MSLRTVDIDEIRYSLENELRRLQKVIDDQKKRQNHSGLSFSRNSLAWKYEQRKRSRKSQMEERTQKKLAQVEAALNRMNKKTYGKCAKCGEVIPPVRLEVVPYAELCIECQINQEK